MRRKHVYGLIIVFLFLVGINLSEIIIGNGKFDDYFSFVISGIMLIFLTVNCFKNPKDS